MVELRPNLCSPVVSGVPDGSLSAQMVALLQIEGVLLVGVVPWFELLGCQVGLVMEAAQQLALRLGWWRLRHLQTTTNGSFKAAQTELSLLRATLFRHQVSLSQTVEQQPSQKKPIPPFF